MYVDSLLLHLYHISFLVLSIKCLDVEQLTEWVDMACSIQQWLIMSLPFSFALLMNIQMKKVYDSCNIYKLVSFFYFLSVIVTMIWDFSISFSFTLFTVGN